MYMSTAIYIYLLHSMIMSSAINLFLLQKHAHIINHSLLLATYMIMLSSIDCYLLQEHAHIIVHSCLFFFVVFFFATACTLITYSFLLATYTIMSSSIHCYLLQKHAHIIIHSCLLLLLFCFFATACTLHQLFVSTCNLYDHVTIYSLSFAAKACTHHRSFTASWYNNVHKTSALHFYFLQIMIMSSTIHFHLLQKPAQSHHQLFHSTCCQPCGRVPRAEEQRILLLGLESSRITLCTLRLSPAFLLHSTSFFQSSLNIM